MSIVLDVHRRQITFDWVDHATGEVGRGRVAPATREVFASWLATLPAGDVAFAVEACTGWRFVVDELERAGFAAHLAEPADILTLKPPTDPGQCTAEGGRRCPGSRHLDL